MRIKHRMQAQAPAQVSYSQPRGVLASRPFAAPKPTVSASGKQPVPDAEAQTSRAKPKGFHFGLVRVQGRNSSFSSGRSLPGKLRRKMEAAFKTDLSDVRVHEDDRAETIGANAFTQGNEIHFARGKYQPDSGKGQALIGHELTHVVQQRTGRTPVPQGQGTQINRDRALEAEADAQGHRAAMGRAAAVRGAGLNIMPHAIASKGSVMQCQDSEDEDDPEFVIPEPKKKRKADPNAEIKKGTEVDEIDPASKKRKLSYETIGGVKHEETHDPLTGSSVVTTTGLQWGQGFRNKTIRDKKDYRVHNPYKLSKGQSSRNQAVVSHQTPSWLGMGAGGKFSNKDLTSSHYNSLVEDKEKGWREGVSTGTDKYSYQTETETESLVDDDRIKEIAKKTTNPRWDEDRIKERLERVEQKYPNLKRVARQKRVLTNERDKKKKTFSLGPDLFLGIPVRAYDKNAHKKYLEARKEESEGSDEELEEKPKKKQKKKKQTK